MLDEYPKGWDRVNTSPTPDQRQTSDRGEMSNVSRQSAISPVLGLSLHLHQEPLCGSWSTWYCTPSLCPQDPADEESLNGLDFHSREPDGCFYNFPARNLRYLEITVACDTHITLLESDSGLSAHSLSNDFMWVRGLVSHHWSFTSCYLL